MKKKHPPVADLDFARLDLDRRERCGLPEAIYGSGKTPEQIMKICRAMKKAGQPILVTRTSENVFRKVKPFLPGSTFHSQARIITWQPPSPIAQRPLSVAVVCAGTADLPVAEEAAVTAEFYGCEVKRFRDVGVAGLHRLLAVKDEIRKTKIVIAVAGMEGALPSVLAGLVRAPVIAVPTSVGYGANFSGVVPLLAMVNSCGPGVAVVNIDNGFGAGCMAAKFAHA